jgi:hypothetical protein
MALLAGTAMLLSGCSQLHALQPSQWHWPWRQTAAPAPQAVSELVIEGSGEAAAPALPQYWDGNALRVDLAALTGAGTVRLRPRPGSDWPVRLEFTVLPGGFRRLEVRGEQRVLFAVPGSGAAVLLQLAPGTYTAKTSALLLAWGP